MRPLTQEKSWSLLASLVTEPETSGFHISHLKRMKCKTAETILLTGKGVTEPKRLILSLKWGHLTSNVQNPKITLKMRSKIPCHTPHPPSVSTGKMSAFKQFTDCLSTCRCWLLRSQQTCAQLPQFAQPRGQPWWHPHWCHLALCCLHHMVPSQVANSTFNRTIWNTCSDSHCHLPGLSTTTPKLHTEHHYRQEFKPNDFINTSEVAQEL